MIGLSRARAVAVGALVSLCLPLLVVPLAVGAAASQYTKETQKAFNAQVEKGEVAEASINSRVGNVHVTLKSGGKYVYHYGQGEQQAVESKLSAHGVTATEIKKKKKKSGTLGSHPRRTVAIIVVVVVVILAAAFLLIRRRRGSSSD